MGFLFLAKPRGMKTSGDIRLQHRKDKAFKARQMSANIVKKPHV